MPIAKALKREAPWSKQWWRTLAKWRNLNRRTSSDQELTSNGWTHLSRCVGLERRTENLMARTARGERNRCPLLESHTIRNLRLFPFGSLTKNPLANIRWAVNQYDVRSSHSLIYVHKGDLIQVHECADAIIVYFEPVCC